MKKDIYLSLTLLFTMALFFSCQPQAEQVPAGYENTRLNPDFESDVAHIKSIAQTFFKGDAAAMSQYLHADYITIGSDGETYSRQQEIDGWVDFAQQFKNARLDNEIFYSVIVDEYEDRPEMLGSWVFMWADMHYDRISDGKGISFPLHVVFKLQDGQLLFSQSYFDRLSMFQQLDYQITPPAGELGGE